MRRGSFLVAAVLAGTMAVATAAQPPPARPAWQPSAAPPAPAFEEPEIQPVRAPGGPPTRVRIARIGVDSPLVVLGLDRAGRLQAPKEYGRAGWYGDGTVPGEVGPAVLAGHVDSKSGPAVFYRLHELRPGDTVQVWRGADLVKFRVTAVTRHPKDRFPTAEVYGPTPAAELRLVTCGGQFDRRRGHYRDNVVVFAVAQPREVIPAPNPAVIEASPKSF
jgi:sortase (surface protein transpeptidase)